MHLSGACRSLFEIQTAKHARATAKHEHARVFPEWHYGKNIQLLCNHLLVKKARSLSFKMAAKHWKM